VNRPNRGDIWWVDLGRPVGPEQVGAQSVVVISSDGLNQVAAPGHRRSHHLERSIEEIVRDLFDVNL
jgi:mRNA-degrading endonuclease toxin of MazEF toxin-antitoxin module